MYMACTWKLPKPELLQKWELMSVGHPFFGGGEVQLHFQVFLTSGSDGGLQEVGDGSGVRGTGAGQALFPGRWRCQPVLNTGLPRKF